jgi:hypothetical protein
MPQFPVLTILPLSATIIAAAFAIVILNHYLTTRRRPHELIWGIAFILFALGAACQVFADINGSWSPLTARVYYLTGPILNVGFLGLGTVYLLFPRRIAHISLAVMLAVTAVSVYVLFTVPVSADMLRDEAGWKAVTAYSVAPRWLAAIVSTIGTVLLVGGALWSAYVFWRKRIMKHRMIGVLLLAVGTIVVALGGTITGLTGLRNHDYLYITMAIGVAIMFMGYLQTIRPEPVPKPKVAAEPVRGHTPTAN